MAKNITIKIGTAFDAGGIKTATMSFSDFEKVAKNVQQSLAGTKSTWERTAAAFEATINGITRLNDVVQSMASAYSNAELNATRLETVMRQRMKSTDAEVSSIKRLTSAQADLGIISAGVQRAGAQQLATYLYQKSSLEVLIPAMNNLVAQQRGYEASAGDAISVANLMGKAMMGMTSSLREVGITFDEAQEAAIKNGNEQERAAMVAQIITDNVGQMNAALAKTQSGKVVQMRNDFAKKNDRGSGQLHRTHIPLRRSRRQLIRGAHSIIHRLEILIKQHISLPRITPVPIHMRRPRILHIRRNRQIKRNEHTTPLVVEGDF